MVKNFTLINERLCVIRIKGRFFNYSSIIIHAPTNDSEEEAKDQFYEQLERAYAAYPSHDVKLVMGDKNARPNPRPNLALLRWAHLQPDRSLLDRRKTLF
jgi:hypothetical protein